MFQVSIYFINSDSNTNSNKYHLVIENTLDSTIIETLSCAYCEEELYQKAFEAIDSLRKSTLLLYIEQKQNNLQKQEEISLGVAKTFLKLRQQEKASYYFQRASHFNRQRNELDQEVVNLISSSLSYLSSLPTPQ